MKEKYFPNKVSRPSNPPDELAQHVSKNPVGRNIPPLFFESSESDRFFIYSHDSIFGLGELIQNGFRAAVRPRILEMNGKERQAEGEAKVVT